MPDKKIATQLRSKIRWGIVGVFALLLIAGSYVAPQYMNRAIDAVNGTVALGLPHIPEKNFALGLDLQGGAQLIFEADTAQIPASERAAAVDGVRDVIERRVNGLGVGEPSIQTTKVGEEYRVLVELPGVTDVNQAIRMIGETPILEFREQNTEPPRTLTEDEKKEMEKFNVEAKKRAENVLDQIKKGKDFGEAATEFSDDPQNKANKGYAGYLGSGTPYQSLYEWAAGAKPDELVVKPLETPDAYHVVKRGGERDGDAEAKVSHILVCYLGASRCDNAVYTKEEAKQKAQELFDAANAGNFADLAKANSTDLSNKDSGGDLGFFGKGVMTKTFEDAAFNAQVGQIVGPVETEFGFHVLYKTDEKKSKQYELSDIIIRKKMEQDYVPPAEQFKATGLSGKQLERAEVTSDPQTGTVQVALQFDPEGKALFRDLTEKHIGKPIAIYLDGEPISIPTVQSIIPDGRAVITGNFNLQSARLLAQRLNAGALPVPVELISQQNVGATLGAESLEKSLKAGAAALVLVMLFLMVYYRLPGLLAVIALVLYAALSLAVFKLIGVTLTLAGIAGFILSVGMAVDANILIFERLKEELREGKSLRAAVEEGFLRAWTSIRESSVATLITCILLTWFGTSFVKGFAITLSIGVLLSMFTAVTITRVLLRFVVPWFAEKGNWMFLGAASPEKRIL